MDRNTLNELDYELNMFLFDQGKEFERWTEKEKRGVYILHSLDFLLKVYEQGRVTFLEAKKYINEHRHGILGKPAENLLNIYEKYNLVEKIEDKYKLTTWGRKCLDIVLLDDEQFKEKYPGKITNKN